MSEYFSMSKGVKQDRVLSSMLFSLNIDPLLLKLKQFGVGCHIIGKSYRMLTFLKNNSILFQKKNTT